jgi:hypothetical protein
MIGLDDQIERLTLIRREDELKDQLVEMRSGQTKHMAAFAYSRDLGCDP